MSEKQLVATDRAALMLQLVPYLIGKGEVSLAEAADEFDVTVAQMRAMVEKLTVIGRPGDAGFWQMANDLFDIDWDLLDERDIIVITNTVGLERAPRLTAREAAALLAGLQVAATLPGVAEAGVVQGLLAKLAAGASSAPAEVIVAPGAVDDVRVAVAEALRRGVAVSFTYQAPDRAPATRTVDPVKVHIASGQWYLQGWCHLRQAMRTFHLDRVSDVQVTEIPITHGGETVPELFHPAEDDPVTEVRLSEALLPLLGDLIAPGSVQAESGTRSSATAATRTASRVAHLRVGDERSLKRLAARHAGGIEIVAPAAARRAAADWAAAGLAQYT